MTPKSKPRDGVLRGGSALAIRLLFLAAALISAYLLSVSLSGGTAVGCAPGSSCDAVLKSRWGYFLGIPVSLFAVLPHVLGTGPLDVLHHGIERTAVLLGWRQSTVDVDIKVDPESDRLFRAFPQLKEKLHINIELASPDQFIPEVPGWQERSAFIAREGRLSGMGGV